MRNNRDRWGDIYANMPMRKMVALYDYDPQELSPNVDAEVSFYQIKKIKKFRLNFTSLFAKGGVILSHRRHHLRIRRHGRRWILYG